MWKLDCDFFPKKSSRCLSQHYSVWFTFPEVFLKGREGVESQLLNWGLWLSQEYFRYFCPGGIRAGKKYTYDGECISYFLMETQVSSAPIHFSTHSDLPFIFTDWCDLSHQLSPPRGQPSVLPYLTLSIPLGSHGTLPSGWMYPHVYTIGSVGSGQSCLPFLGVSILSYAEMLLLHFQLRTVW